MHVTFLKVEDKEIVEVTLLNGTVAAFMAGDKEPESGKPWSERFGAEYARFKKANEPKTEVKPEPKVEARPLIAGAGTGHAFTSNAAAPAFIPPPADHE